MASNIDQASARSAVAALEILDKHLAVVTLNRPDKGTRALVEKQVFYWLGR